MIRFLGNAGVFLKEGGKQLAGSKKTTIPTSIVYE
jgi:hypothetical protein